MNLTREELVIKLNTDFHSNKPECHWYAMSWCRQAESCEALDKSCDQVLGQVGRGEEERGEVEEARAVFDVHHLRSKKLVELNVELGELEVVLRDERVDGGEGEEGDGATHGVGSEKEVRQQEGSGEEWDNLQ